LRKKLKNRSTFAKVVIKHQGAHFYETQCTITLEGQIQGKKAYRRPRTMLLDWSLKTEEGNISYEELKMFAKDK